MGVVVLEEVKGKDDLYRLTTEDQIEKCLAKRVIKMTIYERQ